MIDTDIPVHHAWVRMPQADNDTFQEVLIKSDVDSAVANLKATIAKLSKELGEYKSGYDRAIQSNMDVTRQHYRDVDCIRRQEAIISHQADVIEEMHKCQGNPCKHCTVDYWMDEDTKNKERIAELERQVQTKWVSVKDKLPNDHENVVAICCGTMGTTYGVDFVESAKREEFNGLRWHYMNEEVTHWLSLPPPPSMTELDAK